MNFSEVTHDTPGISFKNLLVTFLFFLILWEKIRFSSKTESKDVVLRSVYWWAFFRLYIFFCLSKDSSGE